MFRKLSLESRDRENLVKKKYKMSIDKLMNGVIHYFKLENVAREIKTKNE